MSLSPREQQALDSIKDELAASESQLAILLTTFNRLTSGEEMPVRETIRANARVGTCCSRRKRHHPGRVNQRLGLQGVALLAWLLITVSLIAVALVLGRSGSQSSCPESWAVVCADSAPGHSSHPAPHETIVNEAPGPRPARILHADQTR